MAQKGLHKEDIKSLIRKRGKTLSQLARENGLSEYAISAALCVPFPAAEKVISKFIQKDLHEIWPDRYDINGNRISSPRPQYNEVQEMSHGKTPLTESA